MLFHGPSAGALDAESPKSKKQQWTKCFGHEICVFFFPICTIFCMREAVYISHGSRILPSPLGPLNALKTKLFLFFWGSPLGYGSLEPQWDHETGKPSINSPGPWPIGVCDNLLFVRLLIP